MTRPNFRTLIICTASLVGLEFVSLFLMSAIGYLPAFSTPEFSLKGGIKVFFVAAAAFIFIFLFSWIGANVKSSPLFKVEIRTLWVVALVLNIAWLINGGQEFRYTPGSFSPVGIIFYYSAQVVGLIFCLAAGESNYIDKHKLGTVLFAISVIAKIDGLSMALTSFASIMILYRNFTGGRLVVALLMASALGVLGAYAKWADGPDLEKLGWLSARFAIPAVTSFQFVEDEHYIERSAAAWELLGVSFKCRFDFIMSGVSEVCSDQIKSIGGANFFSLYGRIKGGSSAGIVLSLMLLGAGFGVVAIPSLILGQLVRRLGGGPPPIILGLSLYVLLKPIFASVYEIFAIASFSFLLTLSLFVYAFFVRVCDTRPRSVWMTGN